MKYIKKIFNENNVLRTLSIMSFVTQAIFTYLAYSSTSLDTFEKVIAGSVTIVLEGAIYIFFIQATSKGTRFKTFFAILATALFAISTLATLAYRINKENRIDNKAYNDSSQVKIAKSDRDIAINTLNIHINNLATIEKEKKDISKFYKAQIANLEKEKNLKKTPAWRKEQIDISITKKTKEMDKKLEKKDTEKEKALQSIENNKDEAKDIKNNLENIKAYDEVGNLGLASRIQNLFGWDKKNVSLMFEIMVSVLLQVTAIGLHLSWNIKKTVKPMAKPIKQEIKQEKPEKKRKTGFTQEQFKKFLDEVYKTKGKVVIGYKQIRDKLGFTEGVAKSIYQELKDKKIIKVENGSTIIKDRDV